MMLAWLYLAAAIATEVIGTVFLRFTDGFTRPCSRPLVVVTYGVSLWLTALALRELEVSLAYAVWAGVGTAAVAVIGMAAMGESVNALKLASIVLVIGGVVGLNLSGAH
jgi:multidrug transporter EmrE-like cation transporter